MFPYGVECTVPRIALTVDEYNTHHANSLYLTISLKAHKAINKLCSGAKKKASKTFTRKQQQHQPKWHRQYHCFPARDQKTPPHIEKGHWYAAQGDAPGTAYDIYGRNLLGFDDRDHKPFDGHISHPWDLEGQIKAIYQDVAERRVQLDDEELRARGDDRPGHLRPYDSIILMGHSVGAYISVDIFHRHMKNPKRAPHLHLQHGFLLFPTLTNIAKSPKGVQATVLRLVPTLESYGHIYAAYILHFFSLFVLHWILTRIMGFTHQTADVTAHWLKSRDGVRQALHMGISELDNIREEKWEEELWEVAEATETNTNDNDNDGDVKRAAVLRQQTPKFFMFYGKHDHWVANHMRDAFIKKRKEHGTRGGRTKIEVDEGDIPHAFCVQEHTSWVIAKKVAEWIAEIEG
ncbi:hypothetical protein PT974_04412 [Cladobotryum mycophilum]|uniref:Lipid droplet-associated hydrolase n=1 Tax=Cladobotryum mycophilum TaxID=491253 RepID=A0ABR0SW46_9HYPO